MGARMGEEGSLTGIYGPPGSGKGMESAREMFSLIKAGKVKRIITNSPLQPDAWSVPIVFMDNQSIARIKSEDMRPFDCILVDESWGVWEATEWKAVSKETDVKDWVSQARKDGIHFIVVSQAFEEFVFFVRRKLTSAWSCWRFGPLRGSRRHSVEGGKAGAYYGSPHVFVTWMAPKKLATSYDSMMRVGTGLAAQPVRYHKSRWPLVICAALLIGGVIAGGGSLWRAFHRLNPGVALSVSSPLSGGRGLPADSGAAVSLFGESYDRAKMAFYIGGSRVDPKLGVSGNGQVAEWGVEWDVVAAQNGSAGRGVVGESSRRPPRAGGRSNTGVRSDAGRVLGGLGGFAGDPGPSTIPAGGVNSGAR